MTKVLVAEPLADEGIELLRKDFDVDVRTLSKEELLEAIGEYDAVIVRSATKITKEVLERAGNLKAVGRAGIGLDNIDVEQCTRQGVLVVNAPQSNILSAAEHTVALMLALARNVAQADASLRAGRWERDALTGVELHGKVLGILGLGRIGTLVAQRAAGFGMKLLGYDPYVSRQRAAQLGVELAGSVDEVCRQADFLTVHLPKTAETMGIVGAEQLRMMKPTARVLNVSRGGIVDEEALYQAVKDGQVAGAGLDVFSKEPPGPMPIFELPNVVVTPHLGASTEEAQTKAGVTIAEQISLALRGEFAPYAVNVQAGGEPAADLRAYIPLTEKLGRILTGIGGSGISAVHFEVHGAIAEHDARLLTLAGLKGLFSTVVHEPVTFVNAPLMAAERGIDVRETRSAQSKDYVNQVVIRADSDEGSVAVGGTLVGKRNLEHIVQVYDYSIDMQPERYMLFLRYRDRPGVVGQVGSVLGEVNVNIASMQVSRETIGGEALMGLTVDDDVAPEVIDRIVAAIDARDAKFIDIGA
jgi:D-3-phosphoglycerate dehydrogenase / 2-oxoglutarate reductase